MLREPVPRSTITDVTKPGEVFRAYVEQMLAPALEPGDVVVMDNLAAHKVTGIIEAIRAAGASVMYLPPYSPDLNPIECLIPGFDGAVFSREWKDALWGTFTMGAPRRQRQSVERYSIVRRA